MTTAGSPVYRIGPTSSTAVNLEDCSGCGLSGWGWQDIGYGVGARGPEIRFAASGTHTLRIQGERRRTGDRSDRPVGRQDLTAAPGALKNDTTILPRTAR